MLLVKRRHKLALQTSSSQQHMSRATVRPAATLLSLHEKAEFATALRVLVEGLWGNDNAVTSQAALPVGSMRRTGATAGRDGVGDAGEKVYHRQRRDSAAPSQPKFHSSLRVNH